MVASSGFFIITLDAVIVNVALPTLSRDFHADMRGLQWVLDSYTLAFAALLLSAGALSDRLGARLGFGLGLIVFIFSSLACGLALTLHILIAARAFQGLGAALMMPSSMALIRQGYEDPSVDQARAWYSSPAYEAIKPKRHRAGKSKVYIVPGVTLINANP